MGISMGGSTPFIPANQRAEILAQLQAATQQANNASARGGVGGATGSASSPLSVNTADFGGAAGGAVIAGAANANQSGSPTSSAKTVSAAKAGTKMPVTQLLPSAKGNTGSAPGSTPGAMSGWSRPTGASSTGSMAQMLQNFSNSTMPSGGKPVNTSAGAAQLFRPGSAFTSAPTASNAATTAGVSSESTVIQTPQSSATQQNPSGVIPRAQNANSGETTGAAKLRGQQIANNVVPNGAATAPALAAPAGLRTPITNPAALPSANPGSGAVQVTASLENDKNTASLLGKAATAAKDHRPQLPLPDSSLASTMNRMPAVETPEPRTGPIGMGSADPVVQSQQASIGGIVGRVQNALNLELGIPGLTGGNIISIIGVLILLLVLGRVLVHGVAIEEVVILTVAGGFGIVLAVGGNMLGSGKG